MSDAAACPDRDSSSSATSANVCSSDCVFMADLLDMLPDCSTGGVNIKASLQAADYYCGADATGSSDDRS
ncbi:hypothetical protein GN244_ATG09707 [Phytophthora infestans]|uniref:Uncharacterized protein n=1 Tax=Phytophthora infestans TaxID=4787 RepID=A0A833S1S7_PHYIN|nr:hypothetical protein GN244_ATG09707 [Phytophthora infestans]